jgi:hypothetical protein
LVRGAERVGLQLDRFVARLYGEVAEEPDGGHSHGQHGEAHAHAITRALSEAEKGARRPGSFLLPNEVSWVKSGGVRAEIARVLHNGQRRYLHEHAGRDDEVAARDAVIANAFALYHRELKGTMINSMLYYVL